MIPTVERLTHTEELSLIHLFNKLKDESMEKAKPVLDKLVLSNLGLVHKLVNKFPVKTATVTYDDLFQEGVAGLIHGIQKYDPKRGYRLSTYVYNWILAYVRRYYQNHARNVRIPVHLSDSQMAINKTIEKLTQDLGRKPTLDEIRELHPNVDKVVDALKPQSSLNTLMNADGEIGDLQGYDPTEENEMKMDLEILLTQLKSEVSDRDYNILITRFGLDGNGLSTLNDIAESNDITRSRVHQIEHSMLKRLRSYVN